jgi:hypothetical protein
MHYMVLYRGPLSSCNYGCAYCPFGKRSETYAELADDRAALERFLGWVEKQAARGHEVSVLFTPWGEALIRPWYQEALARLTHLSHVRKAAIQTNISCHLNWLSHCNLSKLGLWCTYHPSETSRDRFIARCRELDARCVRYSVGIVGLKENVTEAKALRQELRPDVYLWVNAYKSAGPHPSFYAADEIDAFTAIDPLFPINNTRHPSLGKPCRAGDSVFSVDGAGTMRRCHFIREPIGNIYADDWEAALRPSSCTNQTCGCHIGYVHMPSLGLYEVFGDGVLERIPKQAMSASLTARQIEGPVSNDTTRPLP